MLLALLLHPVERSARSPCAAAFPRRALLRCSEAEPAAGALSRAQNLESLLSLAVKTERYEEAARLRDELASLGVDTELAVLQANNQFYRSFSDADLQVRATAHMLFLLCAKPQPPPRHPPPPLCARSAYAVPVRCLRVPLSQAMGELWASTISGCSLRYIPYGCRRWTSCGLPKAWSRARTRATPRSTGGRISWPRGSPSSARVWRISMRSLTPTLTRTKPFPDPSPSPRPSPKPDPNQARGSAYARRPCSARSRAVSAS